MNYSHKRLLPTTLACVTSTSSTVGNTEGEGQPCEDRGALTLSPWPRSRTALMCRMKAAPSVLR